MSSATFALRPRLHRLDGLRAARAQARAARGLSPLVLLITTAIAALALVGTRAPAALAAGDANQAQCPNEASPGFSSGMPDCRAYELVSPVYGAGAIASGIRNAAPPISPDGDHLLAISFGPFAGTEELRQSGVETGAVYEFSRTSGGWSAEPQDPPASLYPYHTLLGWSASELGRSVWSVPAPLAPGEKRELIPSNLNSSQYLLREGADRFALVGSVVAPGHVVSNQSVFSLMDHVSDDALHIVFGVIASEGLKQLWPGDNTEDVPGTESGCNDGHNQTNHPEAGDNCRTSVYEYPVPNGGEPTLVGVKNAGPPPWRAGVAHVNEGAELLSDCGTEYDGSSADGEDVFFTAMHIEQCSASQPQVNEVYARVEGQRVGARTVAISEPTAGPAGDCDACKESPVRNAAFVASSEEGTKIFFTSEQQLLPGASADNLYEYDFDAPNKHERVSLLAGDVSSVMQVSRNGAHIYFESDDELTAGANGNGEVSRDDIAGAHLFVYNTEAGTMSFVASGEDIGTSDTTRTGKYLTFESGKDLKGTDDTSPQDAPQLFLYDATTGVVSRVSSGQRSSTDYDCAATGTVEEGFDCDGNTASREDAPRLVSHGVDSLAEDGAVVFSSELPLTPQATQGYPLFTESGSILSYSENVYEYRAGQVYLISVGDEATPAEYRAPEQGETRALGIDESGQDVFFSTVDSLVPQDTDTQSSWYDAREGGGFSTPFVTQACQNESCLGSVPAPPSFANPDSESVAGGENRPAPPATSTSPPAEKRQTIAKCAKNHKRVHGKCVKIKATNKHTVHETARRERGR